MTDPVTPHFDIASPIPSRTVSTCYVVRWHDDIVVIDAGEPGNVAHIMEAVDDALAAGGQTIRAILVTHPHPDHAGSLADLATRTGAPVYASAYDKPLVEAGQPGPLASPKNSWLSRFLFKRIVLGGPASYSPCRVSHVVAHGDVLPFCGGIEVIALPGHSAGHIGFLFKTERCVFAGDALLNIRPFAPRLSHWHDDPAAEITSLRSLATYDWRMLYPGHGDGVPRAAFDRMIRKISAAG